MKPRPRRPAGRRRLARAAVLLLLLALALDGCAGQRWEYDKKGVTAVKLDHELRECRREAYRPYTLSIFNRVDADVLNRCMERRGYTVTPVR